MDAASLFPSLPITNSALIFFVVLTIILFAPILLNRLHIPHIIGLIFAGMIVGPYGINLLAYDAGFKIFGNVGLLYLMFLVGLEMSASDFKKNKREGIVFGIYTFMVPMILGLLTSRYMLGLGWLASFLLASVYASHTLIAFPIVSRYGVTKVRSVSISIAGAVITVVGALIVMAVVVGIAGGGTDMFVWVRLVVGTALYSALLLYSYPRITRWFFKKYNDQVSQFVFILALVFAAAYLAEWIGLVNIIGAFFAGIILTRYIPAVSPLMNRIEFVGNALFIPYFLIGVGMIINLRGLTSWHSILIALVMIVVAIVSKWIAAWMMRKSFNLSRRSGNMIFGLSVAQAAATLAAVLIGYEVGLFDDAILNGAILMILVTCAVSAFVTEEAAKEIALGLMSGDGQTKQADNTEKILVPVSNPLSTDLLINLALVLKNPRSRIPLCLLNVINDARQDNPAAGKISENTLLQASKIAAAADTPVETISRYDMNVAGGIIHTIKERRISEVLLGLHHKANIADTFFGVKTEALLKGSNKMVLIAKMHIPANTVTRIVVAVPEKAEYETGFAKWVNRAANMASQLGCRIIFYGHQDTLMQIKGRLLKAKRNIRAEFQMMDKWGDILMLTGVVLEDDLFMVVSARPASVSYNPDFEKLPSFLSRYFCSSNLVVLYPEQFGEEGELTFFSDPLAMNVGQNHDFMTYIRNNVRSIFSKKRIKSGNKKE